MTERERLTLEPIAADPEIGRWLSAFEEVRRDTIAVVREIPPDAVDSDPDDGGDGVGTVLYHLALVEIDWVFSDVLGREQGISREDFPYDSRDEDGHLTPVRGETMEHHLDRLERTRSTVLDILGAMSSEEYHRPRAGERFDVAADWTVFHLIDHEVEHRVRLSALRDGFRTRR